MEGTPELAFVVQSTLPRHKSPLEKRKSTQRAKLGKQLRKFSA